MSNSPLDIATFGRELIKTRDLDPVYCLLYPHRKDDWIKNWLLAYWCFYHVGTASWIADQSNYWDAMMTAAASSSYPRSSERRHFRAKNAVNSISWLSGRGVYNLFDPLYRCRTVGDVMKEVQTWVGFGPWISFKVADMLERLDLAKIEFNDGAMFLFDSPQEGARLMWKWNNPMAEIPSNVGPWAVDTLLGYVSMELAPPGRDRYVNAQEAETILCKWKSYLGGHYHVGEDIEACRAGLLKFSRCRTSQKLLKAGRGVLWA